MPTRWIDLSHPLRTGTRVYPGDPAISITPALTCPSDGVNVLHVHMGSQSGTHVDAPFHVDNSLPKLDDVPLETFAGPAVVVDVRGRPPRTELGPEVLQDVRDRLKPGVTVLLATGWDAHWELPTSPADPARTHGLPQPWQPSSAFSLVTHLVLARQGCVIVENLRGLGEALEAQEKGESVEVFVMPMRLEGGDGAPVRAVAKVTSAA